MPEHCAPTKLSHQAPDAFGGSGSRSLRPTHKRRMAPLSVSSLEYPGAQLSLNEGIGRDSSSIRGIELEGLQDPGRPFDP